MFESLSVCMWDLMCKCVRVCVCGVVVFKGLMGTSEKAVGWGWWFVFVPYTFTYTCKYTIIFDLTTRRNCVWVFKCRFLLNYWGGRSRFSVCNL